MGTELNSKELYFNKCNYIKDSLVNFQQNIKGSDGETDNLNSNFNSCSIDSYYKTIEMNYYYFTKTYVVCRKKQMKFYVIFLLNYHMYCASLNII
jgi:hypothetical protein